MIVEFSLCSAAQCRGVSPLSSPTLGSAPVSISTAIMAGSPLCAAAQCNRVPACAVPHVEISASVHEGGNDGGISVVRSRPMQRHPAFAVLSREVCPGS